MILKPFDIDGSDPDRETLLHLIDDYREFVGPKAAFHIEHVWWPGNFEDKEEEMDFFFDENSAPDDYETLNKWHDDASYELAKVEVEQMDTKFSLNVWRVLSAILLIPYLVLLYFWKTNT